MNVVWQDADCHRLKRATLLDDPVNPSQAVNLIDSKPLDRSARTSVKKKIEPFARR